MFRSVTWRLTFYYGAILALTFLILGLSVYAGLTHLLRSDALRAVGDQAHAVARFTADGNGEDHMDLDDQSLVSGPVSAGFMIQITDPSGRPVNRSANLLGTTLPVSRQKEVAITSVGGQRMAFASLPLQSGDSVIGTVQVARPLRQSEEFLALLARLLLWGGGIALVSALVGGAFLARTALRPVDTIMRTARRITAGDLSQRIAVSGPQDELYLLGETFNHMLERLEQSFSRQRAFVADASHELRTPLSVIAGHVHLLLRWGKEDRLVVEESLRAVARETGAMTRLVSDLLFLAREDADPNFDTGTVDLAALVTEIYLDGRVMSGDVEVSLGPVETVYVQGDRERLKRALMALLENGIKYNHPGGKVTISLGYRGNEACVVVEDTGTGIPNEDLPHIFERFYRSDHARSRKGGAGLGLPIAKKIIETHQGAIRVESEIGSGTRAIVNLPAI